MIKNTFLNITAIVIALFVLSGCQAIGEVFKAGVWSGIIIVVLILGVVIYLFNRSSRK